MTQAIWLEQQDQFTHATLRAITPHELGTDGEVLVSVHWSGLNYKDALAITGRSPVVRQFPMIPGIDFSGVVESSTDPGWQVGDSVLLTGYGYGEKRFGGLAAWARVQAEHLVRLPEKLSLRDAMVVGTAGLTAMLCVLKLEAHGLKPESGPILVTGAGGGVGGIAIALLAARGYTVLAATGRASEHERLRRLGANQIVDRAELSAPGKPLAKERWAGAVDVVGSHTLANVCAGTQYGGVVAACGLAQGMDFPATVAPFILRGVTLAGVDSVYAPMTLRLAAWDRLAQDLAPGTLQALAEEISLEEVIPQAERLLDGQVSGRYVVRVV